jgi:hypothetical protein
VSAPSVRSSLTGRCGAPSGRGLPFIRSRCGTPSRPAERSRPPRPRRLRPLRPPSSRLRPPAPTSSRAVSPCDRDGAGAEGATALACGPGATSYCPLSSLFRSTTPFCPASITNLLNRLNPAFRSSKFGSICCITCLSRSERITSPLRTIWATASAASSQGSRWVEGVSTSLVRPARSL